MRSLFIILTLFLVPNLVVAQTAAHKYFNKEEMAQVLAQVKKGAGGMTHSMVNIDRLEYQSAGEGQALWDIKSWYGGDKNRLWIKSEGEYGYDHNAFEEAEVELLYGRAISTYFDLQVGVGQGLEKGPSQSYATVGFTGLAPYWFEVDGHLKLSDNGDIWADFEAEYELMFTQKLILEPRLEMGLSFQDSPTFETGSGVTHIELGARLRYEFTRKFAPYIGVAWHRSLGNTADIIRLGGENPSKASFVLGLKTWF